MARNRSDLLGLDIPTLQTEWRDPSRASSAPWRRMWRSRSRRFSRDRELERVGISGIWQLGRLAKAQREDLAQGVDHVLARLFPALALAYGATDLGDVGANPAVACVLVDDRQPKRLTHALTVVEGCPGSSTDIGAAAVPLLAKAAAHA